MRVYAAVLMLCLGNPLISKAGTITFLDLANKHLTFSDDTSGRVSVIDCGGPACDLFLAYPTGATSATSPTDEIDIFDPDGSESDRLVANVSTFAPTSLIEFVSSETIAFLPLGIRTVEDGTIQTAFTITYKDIAGGIIGTDTIKFQSGEDTPGVSEPSLLVLTGLLLLAIVCTRRLGVRSVAYNEESSAPDPAQPRKQRPLLPPSSQEVGSDNAGISNRSRSGRGW
jgi:hypothetical protein